MSVSCSAVIWRWTFLICWQMSLKSTKISFRKISAHEKWECSREARLRKAELVRPSALGVSSSSHCIGRCNGRACQGKRPGEESETKQPESEGRRLSLAAVDMSSSRKPQRIDTNQSREVLGSKTNTPNRLHFIRQWWTIQKGN